MSSAEGRTQTLHGLFLESAARRPDHLCLKFDDHPGYTYGEIEQIVLRCASHIVMLDSQVIALVAPRCYGLMFSLLGVLRAGKAYCPIEPDFPPSRVSVMLEAADIKHVVSPHAQVLDGDMAEVFQDIELMYLYDNGLLTTRITGHATPASMDALSQAVPDNTPAYVLFTSGSTGKPKGCIVPHRGSSLYAREVVAKCNLTEDMVYMLKTPYVFDVHVQDIFTALGVGGTMVIADPGAHRDAAALVDLIVKHGINCCCFVPTLLVEFVNRIVEHADESRQVANTLKRVLTIGEALMADTCQQFFNIAPDLEIHNLYGPTEASVGVSHQICTKDSLSSNTVVVPIGKPFGYVSFLICDPSKYDGITKLSAENMVPVREGEIGELFIGGDCLALGYVKNPDKTEAAFFTFPSVMARPPLAASPFTLYKTGDLVKVGPDGVFEYMGRNDFQVKIGGVRIECEEVSAVLKTHQSVKDALVTAFDGPFGKALAAYLVISETPLEAEVASQEAMNIKECGGVDDVAKWGEVYDEMYKTVEAISDQDPTLNWSGYIDTYTGKPHIEPVIKEWVEWSCEQVSRHQAVLDANRASGIQNIITELGTGNGMLLFRLARFVGKKGEGRYIGTDISTSALDYVKAMATLPQFSTIGIETEKMAAHELLQICDEASNDVVLCNGVTMYFPSVAYLLECMQTFVKGAKSGGFAIVGDIQSKRHLLPFRCNIEAYKALRRENADAASVLRAARKAAAFEELSYFDDTFFHRLDRSGSSLFDGRMVRMELRLKRGWWHSEFNRFRYDVEIVVGDTNQNDAEDLQFQHVTYEELTDQLQLSNSGDGLVDPRLMASLPGWVTNQLEAAPPSVDGFVVVLPNARTLAPVRLMQWLEAHADKGTLLKELPRNLYPQDASLGTPEGTIGIEPEALFMMRLPNDWTQRVVWDEDPAMMRAIFLRKHAAEKRWLSAACRAPSVPLPNDLGCFKNRTEDFAYSEADPRKLFNDAFKLWASTTSLLPAMRPTVYIRLDAFPLNRAGKVDRGALPDAGGTLQDISDASATAFESASTDMEHQMVLLWESVVKTQVGVTTPFIAYGGHSLTALQLCSKVFDTFGKRPDLMFLTSEDCTVRSLIAKLGADTPEQDNSSVVRLSPLDRRGMSLLIFGAAGASAATYRAVADLATSMQVFVVELPGRGNRAHESLETNFDKLIEKLEPDVQKWAEQKRRFFVWGDSLGTMIGYSFACKWQQKGSASVLSFFVSGNADPIVASSERGTGENITNTLGLTHRSCADMTREDWRRFLIASVGEWEQPRQEMLKLLEGDLADSMIDTLRADCMAYESYGLDTLVRLQTPIFTMRGQLDNIASECNLRGWRAVAGGKCIHKEFVAAGHMLAHDCPAMVATYVQQASLPDFSENLDKYSAFRLAYRLAREAKCTPMASMQKGANRKLTASKIWTASPLLGAMAVPQDLPQPSELCLDGLANSETLMPLTPQVRVMRHGNMQWRLGYAQGNPVTIQ